MKDIKNNTKENKNQKPQQEPRSNLFQDPTEEEKKGKSKFSEWDIVPPNQFINPRIRKS